MKHEMALNIQELLEEQQNTVNRLWIKSENLPKSNF